MYDAILTFNEKAALAYEQRRRPARLRDLD